MSQNGSGLRVFPSRRKIKYVSDLVVEAVTIARADGINEDELTTGFALAIARMTGGAEKLQAITCLAAVALKSGVKAEPRETKIANRRHAV
jgi:hypothetical protein